jgi:hypothetical protein
MAAANCAAQGCCGGGGVGGGGGGASRRFHACEFESKLVTAPAMLVSRML